MKGFKNWLIKEDIYGFEKEKKVKEKITIENPIVPINTEILTQEMMKVEINNNQPFSEFLDEVQWGRDVGAIKTTISPLGSFKSIIRKLSTDLEGNKVWICKKILPYNDILNATREFDESLAIRVIEEVESVGKEETELPQRNYDGLEKLTRKVSNLCKRADILPEVLIYRGIKEIKKNENYLIYFECKGHGVEAPGSSRLEQFIIDMSYDRKKGLIRSFGHEVLSKIRQHLWLPQPSEWDEYFMPKQSEAEITNCIGAALSTY